MAFKIINRFNHMYPPPLDRKPGVQTSKSWPGDKTVDDSVVTIKYMNHTIQFRKGANLFQVPSQAADGSEPAAVTEKELQQALQIEEGGSPRKRAHTVAQRSYSDGPDKPRPRPKSAICVTVDVHQPPVPKRQDVVQGGSPRHRSYTTGQKSLDSAYRCVADHREQPITKICVNSLTQNSAVHMNHGKNVAEHEHRGELPDYVRKAKYYGYTEQQLEYWTQRHAQREGKASGTLNRRENSSNETFDQSSVFVSSKIEQLKQEMRRAQITQNSPRRVGSDKSQNQSQEKQTLDQEQRAVFAQRRKSTGAVLMEDSNFGELDHLPDYTAIEQQQYWTQRRRNQNMEKRKHFPEMLNKVSKELQSKTKQTREYKMDDNAGSSTRRLSSPTQCSSLVDGSRQREEIQQQQQQKQRRRQQQQQLTVDEEHLITHRRPRCKSTPCDGSFTVTKDGDYMAKINSLGTMPKQIVYVKEKEPLPKGLGKANRDDCRTGMSKWIYKGNSKNKGKSCENSADATSESSNSEPIYCEMKPCEDAVLKHSNGRATPEKSGPLVRDCVQVNGKSAVEYESMIQIIKKKSASVPRDAILTNEREVKSAHNIYSQYDKSPESFHSDYVNVPDQYFTGRSGLSVVELKRLERRRKSTGTALTNGDWYSQYDDLSNGNNDYVNFPAQPYKNWPVADCIKDLQHATAERRSAFHTLPKGSAHDKHDVSQRNENHNSSRSNGNIYEQYVGSMNLANEMMLPAKLNDNWMTSCEQKSAFSYSDYEDDDNSECDEEDDNNNNDWDDFEDSR